jgi:general secretion pathway protein D
MIRTFRVPDETAYQKIKTGHGRNDIMKTGRILGALIVVLSLVVAGSADEANAAFKRGIKAESTNNYDEAFQAYSQAHSLKPKDPKYFTAFTRLRFYAALGHMRQAEALRNSGKLQEAVVEFQRAASIDPTNFTAKIEAHSTEDMLKKQVHAEEAPKPPLALEKAAQEAAGPVELQPLSNTLINLRLTETSTMIYKTIGKLAGINVLFDQDYKPQKVTVELNDVTLREALNTVALQTRTFWEPTSSNTILVAADTASKRKEMQGSVMKTFYLRNVSNATELQEAATTLKGILDVTRIQLIPKQNAMIVRGTSDQMVLAQKLLTDIDKPKPEVVIEIAVLQVSRSRIRTLGVNPPTSASVVMVPGTGYAVVPGTGGSGGGGGSGSNGSFTFNSLANLNANNFQVSIPGASLSFLMSDSDTKLIQNPQIRALDNEKATLKIGDRVPIATGSFGSAAGGGGVSALVNTQFQYLDVGVNIDITPHIHSEHEVTLKMSLEVSSVSGTQNIGGISQPIIGQRRIEHETRLQDGEVNLVGGILEDTETNSLSGYPWLSKIPILKYLFAQEDKQRQENEIVFAITPHIVRAQEVTDDNLRLVDLGRGNTVTVGHTDPRRNPAVGAPNTMEQTGTPKTPNRSTPQKAVTPPAAAPKPEPSKAPGPPPSQVPSGATTTTLVRPVKASPDEQSLSIRSPELSRPRSTEATADPCPYGMHSIGTQYGVLNCAFD